MTDLPDRPHAWQATLGRRYLFRSRKLAVVCALLDSLGFALAGLTRRRRQPPPPESVRTILLCRNDHFGDLLMATPLIAALREHLPQAAIHLLVSSGCRDLIPHLPAIDGVHYFDHAIVNRRNVSFGRKLRIMLRQLPHISRTLRSLRIDLAIDLRPFIGNSALLMPLIRPRYSIGYVNGGLGFLYHHSLDFVNEVHFVQNMFAALSGFLPEGAAQRFDMRLHLSEGSDVALTARLAGLGIVPGDRYIVIHPGSGNQARTWPAAQWVELIQGILAQTPVKIVLVGSPGEDTLFRQLGEIDRSRCVNLCGVTTLTELFAVIRAARLLIGLESFSGHIAAALRTPAVLIHTGIQEPVIWKPWRGETVLLTQPVPCAPCHRANGCEAMTCIRAVSQDRVSAAVLAALGESGRS